MGECLINATMEETPQVTALTTGISGKHIGQNSAGACSVHKLWEHTELLPPLLTPYDLEVTVSPRPPGKQGAARPPVGRPAGRVNPEPTCWQAGWSGGGGEEGEVGREGQREKGRKERSCRGSSRTARLTWTEGAGAGGDWSPHWLSSAGEGSPSFLPPQIILFYTYFVFGALQGIPLGILAHQPRAELAVEARSPNHWTIKEVLLPLPSSLLMPGTKARKTAELLETQKQKITPKAPLSSLHVVQVPTSSALTELVLE